MSQITRFEIKKLHGFRDYDLRLKDNTLILVGENGAGKTTVLQLFYYILSGQWSSMAKYQFESVTITIDSKAHILRFADIERSLKRIDHRVLRRLPSNIRHRFLMLLEQSEGQLLTSELESLCAQYEIPIHYLLSELDLFDNGKDTKNDKILKQTLNNIQKSL